MSSQESTMLISTLLFTLLIFPLTSNNVQARFLQSSCPVSSCGDIDNIDYPFRLKTDPPDCGDPAFELSCENNKTVLYFHSGKYYVKDISYTYYTLRVVDVNLADGSCSLPYRSVSIDEVNSDSHYSLSSSTYTSFVKCTGDLGNNPGYRRVPCLSGNGTNVYVSYDTYVISGLQGSCSFLARVPTIYQAVLFPSYENILKLMQSGFDLQWNFECRFYNCYSSGIYIDPIISSIIGAIWDLLFTINSIARFIVAPIVIVVFLLHKYRTSKKEAANKENVVLKEQALVPRTRRYSYSDIIAITNNFRDKLGQGGFGMVYKGQLRGGSLVAVKMFGNSKFNEENFINEVSTLGRIHHVNVVKLIGFCAEGSHHALVLEFIPNGSLDKYIYSRQAEAELLSWEKLLHIALGTAQGVEHLHQGSDISILHFDIKPHNVLLDQNFTPKVSDFGLAKFFRNDQDFVSHSTIRGTMGYIAPELLSGNFDSVSSKSDVYSYGMLLLEMASRRRNIDATASGSRELYFPSWVYDHLKEGGDLELENVTTTEAAIARKLCIVGLWCIQKKPSDRPTMTEVVKMLQANVDDLQLPPSPMSFPQVIPKESQSDSSTELLISETIEQSS
ncbi:hypothetical protein Tsubulata_018724 [Turnera subulata]|uniref:Protein kinase domain-containing protein n=1 Tax=Turnera subulata TaxID=218843 RepID=A0A9Q0JQE1_9ROSI|nr:hypothetical protein Tsubulata_018724 [Turnera subulata]